MAMPEILGCPMTGFDGACKPDLCPWALENFDGKRKCAVAKLAEGSGWSAPTSLTLEQLKERV